MSSRSGRERAYLCQQGNNKGALFPEGQIGMFVIYYNDIYSVVSLRSNVGNVSKYIAIRSAVLSFCLIFKCACMSLFTCTCHVHTGLHAFINVYVYFTLLVPKVVFLKVTSVLS